MIKVFVPGAELWDEEKEEFVTIQGQELTFEHSLVSLSKWESKHHKPYLKKDNNLTNEEALDYYRCMCLTKNVDPILFYCLTKENIEAIEKYVEDPCTATTFSESNNNGPKSREIITAEIIYYWMIALNIPLECQKWHLNKLLTLIRVCEIKNTPPKKRSKTDIMRRNTSLNAARRRRLHSRG